MNEVTAKNPSQATEQSDMCELAYNINGETFEPPENATDWRARKMKPRGAPEVAYGGNGLPVTVPIDATLDMLRNAVDSPGRYRLDAIDEHGRNIEGVQPAYVVVPTKPQIVESTTVAAAMSDRDFVVAEALRHNTELARAVIDRFPEMMHAAAELLRAADGAGLPARVALPAATPNAADNDDDDDNDDTAPSAATSAAGAYGIDLNRIIGDVANNVIDKLLANGLPSFADMADWGDTRKPKPKAPPSTGTATSAASTEKEAESATKGAGTTATSGSKTPADPQPQLNPEQMRQMLAIYTALPSGEAKLARQLAQELTPAERQSWIADLSALPVPEAVAKIRTLLGGDAAKGAVS